MYIKIYIDSKLNSVPLLFSLKGIYIVHHKVILRMKADVVRFINVSLNKAVYDRLMVFSFSLLFISSYSN
jgi:hypothetical protein